MNTRAVVRGMSGLVVLVFAGAGPVGAAVASVNTPVGQVSAQVALDPQAQQVIDQAKTAGAPAQQEEFLVTRAKVLLGEGKYQTALSVANYVLTVLDAKSTGAQDIVTTAKQKIAAMARQKFSNMLGGTGQAAQVTASSTQKKVGEVQSKADQAATHVQGLLGVFGK